MQLILNNQNQYINQRHSAINPLIPASGFGVFVTIFLGTMFEGALIQTLGLAIVISAFGTALIMHTAYKLQDPSVLRLSYIWAAKLSITLILLYVVWIPGLEKSSVGWGFDPQRFYHDAKDLSDNDFSISGLNVNYAGILYYYGFIFALFGHNPVIPAIINSFITLCATLFLLRIGYWARPERWSGDWLLGLAMVLPDVLLYDIMTSRETLMAAIITVVSLLAGRLLIENRFNLRAIGFVVLLTFIIVAIRPVMLLPLVLAFLIILGTDTGRFKFSGLLILTILVGGFLIAPIIGDLIGSYDFAIVDDLTKRFDANELSEDKNLEWSEKSVGLALVPQTFFQMIVFGSLRTLLYIIAPLPTLGFSIGGLVDGSPSDWFCLMISMSSIIYIGGTPLALASLVAFFKHHFVLRRQACIHISFWCVFLSISMGNYIIHDRYRLMATLLFWGCVWLGLRAPRKVIINCYVFFALIGFASTLFYIFFKYL